MKGMTMLVAGVLVLAFNPAAIEPASHPAAPEREIVTVFVTMRDCCASIAATLKPSLEQLRNRIRLQALRERAGFHSIGVALDWDPDAGWTHLKEYGRFDEVAVGGNWFSQSAQALFWTDSAVTPSIPQFIVFEREITAEGQIVRIGARRVLGAERGADAIAAWAARCERNPLGACY